MIKLFKKLFKIFLWFSGILLILITTLFIFIQTDTFNKLALDYAVDKLNKSFGENDGRIQVSSLKGNILTGLTIDSGFIFVNRDTLLEFNYIKLKYNLWGLLDHQILLDNIIINSPKINFVKIRDSTENLIWNFSKLFRSSSEEDTTTSTFDWDIAVNNLKIENGFFETENKFVDSVHTRQLQNQTQKTFDFDNLIVTNLNLELKAEYYRDNKSINLQTFSFNSNSGFNLKNFDFYAGINIKDTVTQIDGLEILTDLSKIEINKLIINKFNPFDSTAFKDIGEKDFEADINIENLNFSDVRFFVPDAGMLDSSIALMLSAKGKYKDFNLSFLTLKLPNSEINVNGSVRNLDEPDNLYLDISAEHLDILAKDINTIYKDPSIPDFSGIGKIYADILFTGTFENFYSKYDIKTDAGFAGGYINLNLKDDSYNGQINTNHLNIGKILNDRSLVSNLNLYADFSGTGFEPNNMNTSAKYIISSSSFMKYNVRHSAGTLKFFNNNISMNIRYSSSIGNALVAGKINIANPDNPVYALTGRVNSLNLAGLTNNADDHSDLNFSFDIKGRGSNLNNINGKFNFDIGDSYYGENQIPKTPLDIEIDNSAGHSSYSISSGMLDLSAKGNFKIQSVSNVLIDNIKLISEAFTNKLIADSNSNHPDYTEANNLSIYANENFNLDYVLTLKDTASFNSFMNPFGILFNGNIKGSIANEQNRFTLISNLDIRNFKYQDTVIVLDNFNSDISLVNNYEFLSKENPLSSVDMTLTANGDEITFQKSVFDSVKVNIELSKSTAGVTIQGKQDSAISAYINGRIDLGSNLLTATFDSVNIKYNNIIANNENDWLINYEPGQRINFEQFAVKSRNVILNVDGDYAFNGNSDLNLNAKDIKLGDLYSVIYPADESKVIVKQVYPIKGSIDKLNINFKGDAENPELSADISTGKLKLNTEENTDVGNLSLKIDYKDESAAADIIFNNAGNKGSLKINGNIPYRNPLSNDSLTKTDFSDKSVDLKLTSKDFQLKYFLKLLPSLPDISGEMNGEITATGNASSPDLKGAIAINDGNFYLGLTGMNYKYNLKTSTENSKLVINNLSMSSISDEARHFDIFGNIDFSGMKINDIDLSTSGDMVFLDKDVTQNEFGVYGYFRAGSGSPAIKIKGNFDKLSITGQLLIIDATISSVPLGGSGYDNKVDNFTYISVSDSADNYAKGYCRNYGGIGLL